MNSLTQFIVDNPFSFVFGSVLAFSFFTFVLCQKRIVERNMDAANGYDGTESAKDIEVVFDEQNANFEKLNPDEKYLFSLVNLYRDRTVGTRPVKYDHVLSEAAKAHLDICRATKKALPYKSDFDESNPETVAIVSNSNITIKMTFADFIHSSKYAAIIFDPNIKSMGLACEYEKNKLYVCALFTQI